MHTDLEEKDTFNNSAFFLLPSHSIFGDFSVLFDTPTPFYFRTNHDRFTRVAELEQDKEAPQEKKREDERTSRNKNGKATRASVFYCLKKEVLDNLSQAYSNSYLDF
jgi:hypothetical protein